MGISKHFVLDVVNTNKESNKGVVEWRCFVNILTHSNALHNRFWMKNTKYYVNMKLVNSLCITICAHDDAIYGLEKALCSLLPLAI